MGKAEIARALGVSRRTLYYSIDSGRLDRGLTCAARTEVSRLA